VLNKLVHFKQWCQPTLVLSYAKRQLVVWSTVVRGWRRTTAHVVYQRL